MTTVPPLVLDGTISSPSAQQSATAQPVLPLAPDGTVVSAPPQDNTAVRHIRDSSLLVIGRGFAQVLDFGTQILLVHYLSKAEYGAFSYALSIVLLFKSVALFELPDTLSRFVPLYREHKQERAVLGAIVLAVSFVIGLGALIAGAINVGLMVFKLKPTNDPLALMLLAIFALSIPVEGLDGLLTALCAIFGGSKAILIRQSFITPVLRVGLAIALIVLKVDVVFLTIGYIVVGVIGVLALAIMFRSLLRRHDLLGNLRLRQFSFPVREIFSFATPLLASTVVWLLMESSDGLLIGYFKGSEAVASFRAVLPVARLNEGIIMTFALLYVPLAARLYARNEHAELADFYCQSALWMTILSFPIMALTFGFASSTTIGLFGSQYADSAAIMALLSLGYFFHTALGFNGLTLKIYKKLNYSVSIDIAAAILNVAVNLLLIPRWGAFGAAVGTGGTLIVHNLLKQWGLWRGTHINLFKRQYILVYVKVFGMAIALFGLQAILPPNLWIALLLGAVASLVVLVSCRSILQVDKTFPELWDLPIVRAILALLDQLTRKLGLDRRQDAQS
jgi:O-antigen/teichoic acid export membrane protein